MNPRTHEWSPLGLALSCVLAALAACVHADNILLHLYEAAGTASLFAGAFMAGAVALCAAVAVSAHDDEHRRHSVGAGLASAGAGVLCAAFSSALPPVIAAVGSGVLLGFGLTCLLRQWGRYYRSFGFKGALFSTGLSFLLASFLWWAVANAGSPFLFCLGLFVLVLGGGFPLLANEIVRADEVRSGFRRPENWVPLITIWQVMRQGWAAVAGLMLSFFMLGLTFEPTAAGLVSPAAPLPLPYLVAAVGVCWTAARAQKTHPGILKVFYRVSLLVAAAFMLAGAFALGMEAPAARALGVLAQVGAAVCNMLGLVILFWSAKSSEVGFSKMFAAFCASCAASMALGMAAFYLAGAWAETVVVALAAAYLVAMLAAEATTALTRAKKTRAAEAPASGELLEEETERELLS